MDCTDIMRKAISLTSQEREAEYGNFYTNMEVWGEFITVYLNAKYGGRTVDVQQFTITAEDAAQFMVLQKITRTLQNPDNVKVDTFIDEACYAAMAGEAALIQQELRIERDEFRG